MKHLKTIFACLLMAVLSIGQVWGADYTYTFSSFTQGSPVVFNVADPALTITLTVAASGQGNSTKPQWNAGSSQARVYAGGKLTIAIENASIDKLVFDYAVNASSGTKPTITGVAGSTSAGTWDAENKTWEGSDTEVIFSTSGTKGNVGFKSIKVYYTPTGGGSVTAPTFTPDGGNFVGSQSVTLAQADSKAIYYTTNGDNPTTDGTLYSAPFDLTETTTVKAAAKDGDAWSSVVEKTFTKLEPLTTMDAIFAAATAADKTATTVAITFDSWVVTGVATNGKNAYLTDDDYKGLIIYDASGSNTNPVCGLAEGDVLSGTAICKVQLYNYAAQLTTLNASDLTIVHNGEIPLHEVAAADVTSLDGHNVGSLIKVNGKFTYDNSKYYINGLQLYNSLCSYTNPNTTNDYNCTGVFIIYKPYSGDDVPEICPRKSGDIEMITSKTLSEITLGGTYPTEFEQDDAFSHAGMTVTAHYSDESTTDVTEFATFTGYNMANTGEQTVTVHYSENTTEVTTTYTITVNEPTPTGDFEELDGELVAGDYLIYDGGSLMLAEISSNRFAYEEKEPDANGIISNPSQYAVWTLAKSGDYWTFYNSKAGKYAAGTGASGKAQLLDGDSDDKAKWAIDDDLVVTNKYNADNNVNATLRHNYSGTSNYGFACYSATQGGKPVFYKVATPSYYISETLTGCSAADGNPTKVPQTLTEDVELKYNLTTGYVWPDAITVTVGGVALDPNESDYLWDNTKAPAELTIAKEKVNGNIVVTITAIEKALDNITIDLAPNKVTYETGEFFNPAGLRIQLNYTAGASDVVEYSNLTAGDFTFSPNLETALAPENTVVEITYGGKSVNQAITVTDPVPEAKTVVIIAEFDSKLYAMSNVVDGNQCEAIEVTKNGDNLVVASAEEKAAVQWYMSKLGTTVNLQEADENGKYLSGNSSNASFAESDDKVDLTMTQAEGKYIISAGGTRAIMYRNTGVFKHYSTGSSASEYAKVSEIFEVADGATNIEVVAPEVHEFVVDPDEAVAFGTVEVDETVAPKSFNVTLTGIASATVTLSDDAAFSIDKSALDADGTITVTPNTATAGNFSATITLHDEADVATDKVINVTMKVVEPKDCDGEDDFNTVSTASSYDSRTSTAGWSAVNTAVITGEDITYWVISGGTDEVGVITSPELNGGIGKLSFDYKYTFSESNGVSFKVEIKQNGALVEGKSYTITNATAVQSTVYTETIDNINVDGKFQIVITNLSPSNKTGHKDRFAIGNLCWKNYSAPEPPTPVYTEVRTGLTAGNYYTVCWPKAMTAIKGGTLWSFAGKDASTAYLIQQDAPFVAGRPYIIYATADKLEAVVEGDDATAGYHNGLYGTLSYMDADALETAGATYMLKNNELRPIGTNNHLDANRAYVILSEIPAGAPNNAPAHKVRAMPMQPQVVTDIDAINASEKPMKMMINGQIFILRGEKMYDTTGRLVK